MLVMYSQLSFKLGIIISLLLNSNPLNNLTEASFVINTKKSRIKHNKYEIYSERSFNDPIGPQFQM